LDCIHDTVPVFGLYYIGVGIILPNDLHNVVLLIESLVDDEICHVKILFAIILSIDVVQLEDHIEKAAINKLCLLGKVN